MASTDCSSVRYKVIFSFKARTQKAGCSSFLSSYDILIAGAGVTFVEQLLVFVFLALFEELPNRWFSGA